MSGDFRWRTRAGHVEARCRGRTGPGRHRGLRRGRMQRPAPRRRAAQRDPHRRERHRPSVHGGGLDPRPRRPGSLQAYASMDEKAVPNMETDEEKQISASLLDRDIVVMLGGLGGELGGWGMSLVGRVARILGDASVAFATVPFTIEGPIRRQLAEAQLRLLQKRADGVVTFSNDRLLQFARDLPLTKAFAVLGAIMARPAAELGAVLTRSDVVPLRRTLAGVREWRFGMGAGREKHRCFVAVEEAYASPWFTSLPEEISHAIVLMSVPEPDKDEIEILQEIRRRSPHAVIAWASLPSVATDDRTIVQVLAGI